MNNTSNNNGFWPEKTRIVEVVGPAGAGKTTFCQMLDCSNQTIRLENFPDVRKAADAPFFISNCLNLIPNLLRLYRPNSRHLTRREFAWMAILNGWPAILRKESNDGNKIIILDQGPVYLLAEMRLFGPEYLRQKAAEGLWQNLFKRWRDTLYLVVWLDAANEVLFNRINTRQQEHIVKSQPAAVVYEFLGRYRAEYKSILSILGTKKSGFKVLQFDTEQQRPQDIMRRFLSELNSRPLT
jgi:adenylate kinase family enzyme